MVSAFWHGFYPIYYFLFFLMFTLIEISKDAQKYSTFIEKIVPSSIARYVIAQLFTKYIYSYILVNHFALLEERVLLANRNMRFIPLFVLISLYIAFKFLLPLIAGTPT